MWDQLLDIKVGALMTANLGAAVTNNLVANADSYLHLLVSAGQIGVAIVTIIYIIKKIRSLPKKIKKQDEQD